MENIAEGIPLKSALEMFSILLFFFFSSKDLVAKSGEAALFCVLIQTAP